MKYLLLVFLPFYGFTQNSKQNIRPTYVDALKLQQLADGIITYNIRTEILSILHKYGTEEELKQNPYLVELIELKDEPVSDAMIIGEYTNVPIETVTTRSLPDQDFEAAGTPSIGWQEAAINGIATFMAGRFRQEVIHYGLKNVFEKISTEDSLLFEALLPQTVKQIKQLEQAGERGYYSSDLVFLRQVINSDLENLKRTIPENIHTILPGIVNEPLTYDMLSVAGGIYHGATSGLSLPEIFARLSQKTFKTPAIKQLMEFNCLLSEALKDTVGSDRLWIDLNKLNGSLEERGSVQRYFFGLLFQQMQNSDFAYLRDMEQVRNGLAFYSELNAANQYVKSLNYKLDLEQGLHFIHLLNGAMVKYFESSHYIIPAALPDGTTELIWKLEKVLVPLSKKQYQAGIVTLIQEFGNYLPGKDNDTYKRTLVFTIQLAETESAEEMEALLKAYALPIGGSSIKRASSLNVSVNGYVGLTAGSENALGAVHQKRTNIGLAAPIGISTTFNGNWTVFASIIDLGSIVNVRLNNDTTQYSGVKFEHFITPGIGLYYNFKNSPFTLGAHFSYISNLRNIEYSSGSATVTETNVSVTRFNVSVLVDIPFFTAYNKPRK